MSFIDFRNQVNSRIQTLINQCDTLLEVDIEREELWNYYLDCFPAGTNPIYKERREYDCNCCKSFIKNVGALVGIADGKLVTVWPETDVYPFSYVSSYMDTLIKTRSIKGLFSAFQSKIGIDKNVDGNMHTWSHFYFAFPNKFVDISGRIHSEMTASYDVLKRSIEEISDEAIATVLDLISSNSIYRGQEHLHVVQGLAQAKVQCKDEISRWSYVIKNQGNSRFKNTVIGTLLEDLSNNTPLEVAVKAFESKVAPQNYKRTTSLITQKMIDLAKTKIETLGLNDSLARRHATLSDISVNDIIFVDRTARNFMQDSFDALKPTKVTEVNFDKVASMGIDDFIKDVLPRVESMEVFFDNKFKNNLVTLTAPQNKDAPLLFKWSNNFGWSYAGNFTDAIKERVKSAGGNVDAYLRASLSWHNQDDLDLHAVINGMSAIYWRVKRNSALKGTLDVDMNAFSITKDPVENIVFTDPNVLKGKRIDFVVNNFNKRTNEDQGYTVQIELDGATYEISSERNPGYQKSTTATSVDFSVNPPSVVNGELKQLSKEVWNIKTGSFVPVQLMMFSPNAWGENIIGNLHYMFMLKDCKNPEPVNGFYNEFLRSELTEHRKVFEVLASSMKAAFVEEQLSGLGFSSTMPAEIMVRVKGAISRNILIKI